jgi:hypothetical protein
VWSLNNYLFPGCQDKQMNLKKLEANIQEGILKTTDIEKGKGVAEVVEHLSSKMKS